MTHNTLRASNRIYLCEEMPKIGFMFWNFMYSCWSSTSREMGRRRCSYEVLWDDVVGD